MPAMSFEMMNHFTQIKQVLTEHSAQATINLTDFILHICNGKQSIKLYPQFQNSEGLYETEISNKTIRFIGWRPHEIKSWETASDKIAFKNLLLKWNIATPNYQQEQINKAIKNFIIKPNKSSFGKGIRGPFKSAVNQPINKKSDEFFEEYIDGDIVKIWYWEHKPIAAEIMSQLSIIGDGHSTISELIQVYARCNNRTVDPNYFKDYLLYQGYFLDNVICKDFSLPIDFRYKSAIPTAHLKSDIYLHQHPILKHSRDLLTLGQAVKDESPPDFSDSIIYAVDAIIDKKSKVWVLEMNSNPHIHPYLYHDVITSLLNKYGLNEEQKN